MVECRGAITILNPETFHSSEQSKSPPGNDLLHLCANDGLCRVATTPTAVDTPNYNNINNCLGAALVDHLTLRPVAERMKPRVGMRRESLLMGCLKGSWYQGEGDSRINELCIKYVVMAEKAPRQRGMG
ncbi:hypothetical protein PAAG_04081 [Paracoccidioides lutzii Pb01]|uniref:Uncharacterized protein n=1 Tax=Paracoccidioides lutzii (strain ATCC MYA-826 / Pb01) TaxID=502779 RepID=C1GZY7_PARBA|nr:hypothetical protein PAAG_04081 [Paracoccidioides lutzii Pb01]EEH33028.2 hypothetical protein PAAG_04081 [Paracoccidioides lutzii Pb01]